MGCMHASAASAGYIPASCGIPPRRVVGSQRRQPLTTERASRRHATLHFGIGKLALGPLTLRAIGLLNSGAGGDSCAGLRPSRFQTLARPREAVM